MSSEQSRSECKPNTNLSVSNNFDMTLVAVVITLFIDDKTPISWLWRDLKRNHFIAVISFVKKKSNDLPYVKAILFGDEGLVVSARCTDRSLILYLIEHLAPASIETDVSCEQCLPNLFILEDRSPFRTNALSVD